MDGNFVFKTIDLNIVAGFFSGTDIYFGTVCMIKTPFNGCNRQYAGARSDIQSGGFFMFLKKNPSAAGYVP
jgi:hypothetical protein